MQPLDQDKLWGSILLELELSISKANFNTWFKNTFISKVENGVVFLSVPNAFVKDWLIDRYHKLILKSLRNHYTAARNIEYLITPRESDFKKKEEGTRPVIFTHQPEFHDLDVGRDDGLNPKYNLDLYVVCPFNELAFAAAQAIIKNPGTTYNPLFIYGGTGLGKTHLIQGMGNQIKKADPNKRVYYLTSEKFTVDYVDSVRNRRMHIFKDKYQKYDVLIMDDIQFIAGKDKTQEELFHLFNTLYENNKQIIFSSDKAPKFIPNLEDRLRSRFEGGMIVDISKPDYESRLAILKSKLDQGSFTPSNEVIEYIASVVQDSIRELEGSLNSIICQSQLKKRDLTIQEVKTLIKNNIKPQKTISIKDVIRVVADFYNVEERVLYEKTRKKEVVKPRQIVMYLLREDFNTSYPFIGQKLGGRDHTTVIHACEKIKNEIKKDSTLTQELDKIKGILYGGEVTSTL
jgi:chromosomal replication initiator protein